MKGLKTTPKANQKPYIEGQDITMAKKKKKNEKKNM